MHAAGLRPPLVNGTLAVAQERARLPQAVALVKDETRDAGAMGGGALDRPGEIGGGEIHLDELRGKKDLMRLHVHGLTATMAAAGMAGDGRPHFGGGRFVGPVKLQHPPTERREHRGGFRD